MTRMFLAVVPPAEAVEHLADFLAAQPGPGGRHDELRWTRPDQWHVTLAFMPDVPEAALEDLAAGFADAARERTPCSLRVAGAGAFPGPARGRVVYAGVTAADAAAGTAGAEGGAGDADGDAELATLARTARSAANGCGVQVDQQPFVAHLTLARTSRRQDVSDRLRLLGDYTGPAWSWEEVHLLASYPGRGPRGRAHHETVGRWPLGGGRRRGSAGLTP